MVIALGTIFGSSFVLALSGAIMPGPLMTVTISESPRRGAATGPLLILGHSLLELAMVVALISGLAPVLIRQDVFITISLVGGAILLYMGIAMLRSLPGLSLAHRPGNQNPNNLVVMGLLLSAVNPYWLIWWATIGLLAIMHSLKYGPIGVVAFFLGHLLADLGWYSLISFGLVRGQHLLSDRLYRAIIGGCAIVLLAFACWFVSSGVQTALTIA